MKLTRWGIIGPGKIARDFVTDLSLLNDPQKVVALLGDTLESTRQFASDFNIEDYYTDSTEFFTHKDFDVIYIASPHTLHFEHTLACLEREIPVLCEKPLTINAD